MATPSTAIKTASPKETASIMLKWREQMGYSTREAAEVLGCSRNALMGWEAGRQAIPRYIGLAMRALHMDENVQPYGSKARRAKAGDE